MTTVPAAESAPVRRDCTADGVLIEPGLAVWNYDYRRDEVVRFLHEENGNGWYETRLGMFDGSRMTTGHPGHRGIRGGHCMTTRGNGR